MRALRLLTVLLAASAAGGCTLMADLDRFEVAGVEDFEFSLDGFVAPHRTDPVLLELVTPDTKELGAIAILDPFMDPDWDALFTPPGEQLRVTVSMPGGIPEGDYELQFWADLDRDDGVVNTNNLGMGIDHSWVLPDARALGSTCSDDAPNCFAHVTPFDVINEPLYAGNDVEMSITMLTATTGFIEVHLVEVDDVLMTRSVRGIYRYHRPNMTDTSAELTIPGVAFDGFNYELDTFADLDGDGVIDPQSEVWVQTALGEAFAGVVVTVEANPLEAAGALPVEGLLVTPVVVP